MELYNLGSDPHCLRNVAEEASFAAIREDLEARLMDVLVSHGDPRVVEPPPCRYEAAPYAGMIPKYADGTFLEKMRAKRARGWGGKGGGVSESKGARL